MRVRAVKRFYLPTDFSDCGVGVRFLTTLGIGIGFFCPTLEVQLGHFFLYHTPMLGIPVEMVQILLELLLQQNSCHDFH